MSDRRVVVEALAVFFAGEIAGLSGYPELMLLAIALLPLWAFRLTQAGRLS